MEANLKNIKKVLGSQGRTMKWLRESMDIKPSTFYGKCNTKFTKSELFYMSHLLGVEFNE